MAGGADAAGAVAALLVLLVVLIVALPGPPWPLLILGWLWCAGVFRRGRRWHGSTHW